MVKQERRKLVKKKQKTETTLTLEIAESFDVASAKENDFDLDLDCAKFQGRKGQAGSRSKSLA